MFVQRREHDFEAGSRLIGQVGVAMELEILVSFDLDREAMTDTQHGRGRYSAGCFFGLPLTTAKKSAAFGDENSLGVTNPREAKSESKSVRFPQLRIR
jgi:hypothetical protein